MSKPTIQCRRTGQYPFVMALWVVLITAVVSALAPEGLPSTRAIGSAFDPSTNIAVLRSRSPLRTMVVPERRGDDPADLAGPPAPDAGPSWLGAAYRLPLPGILAPVLWSPMAIAYPPASPLRDVVQPRAPPAA